MTNYPQVSETPGKIIERSGVPIRAYTVTTDVAVIGGGLAGICAAIAASRHGARTILIQDRPVLGGNSSSEIRISVNGAESLGHRETGIIEELLLANRFLNPQNSYTIWDHLLYDFVTREPNLTLMLNTQCINSRVDNGIICSARCRQSTTESEMEIQAKVYIDCSGDGLLAASAGAAYRTGREAKDEFDESYAPPEADGWQMGASLMMSTRDMGSPMPYQPPGFALKLSAEQLRNRNIARLGGFWWIELGSDDDIIAVQETNRHLLMGYLHGVWDYIKNSGRFPEAANLVLDWVGSVPGKRESRRFLGDYILSQKDLVENRYFEDAVAYGGWPIDDHCPGGILSPDLPPTVYHQHFQIPYSIPFRCLYSRDLDNLLLAGRNISQTHIALASSRVMATCAVMGQASGTAAALCSRDGITPRELGKTRMKELQELLLLDDAYIPGHPALDEKDLARQAKLSASSTFSGSVDLLTDGISRDLGEECHHWESVGLDAELLLRWETAVDLSEVVLKLDTDQRTQLWKVMKKKPAGAQDIDPVPPRLVKRLDIEVGVGDLWKTVASIDENRSRLVKVRFDTVRTDRLRIVLRDTYGHANISIFEVRCY